MDGFKTGGVIVKKFKKVSFLLLCASVAFVVGCSRTQTAEPVQTTATPAAPTDTVAPQAEVQGDTVFKTGATTEGTVATEAEVQDDTLFETSATPGGGTAPR